MRRLVVTLASCFAVIAGGGVVWAAISPPPIVTCGSDDPTCTITVGDPSAPSPGAPGTSTGGSSGCTPPSGPNIPPGVDCQGCIATIVPASDLNADEAAQVAAHGGAYYVTHCYTVDGIALCPCPHYYVPPGTIPGTSGKPAADLAASATFTLPAPKIGTSPGTYAYVGAPTFLYVDGGSWKPVSKSVTDGVKTVTATATPYEVVWDSGDSSGSRYVTCTNTGRPYDADKDGIATAIADLKPPCGYTYSATSADGAELRKGEPDTRADKVVATVHWKISWTCAGDCDAASGTLPDLTASGTTYRVVYQLESLNCTSTSCGSQNGLSSSPPTAPAH